MFTRCYIRSISGGKNIPQGPFIIACNHASFMDDLFMPYVALFCAGRRYHIYVNSRFYRSWLLKKFLDHHGCIPVDTKKDVKDEDKRKRTNKKAFDNAVKYLSKGDVIGIFPEGTRSVDGKLKKARNGVGKLALTARVPVLPVGIIGSDKILPKEGGFMKFRRAKIRIGKPLCLTGGEGKNINSAESVTREVMKSIAQIVGKEYPY